MNTLQILSEMLIHDVIVLFLCIFVVGFMLMVTASHAAGWKWHVSERRRSSRRVPHSPAALPLGRPGHQRLRAHGGRTQIPDGGTVWSVASSTLLLTSCRRPVQSSFNVSGVFCLLLFSDAHSQHEGSPSKFECSLG